VKSKETIYKRLNLNTSVRRKVKGDIRREMRKCALHELHKEIAQECGIRSSGRDLRVGGIERHLDGIRLHKANQSCKEQTLIFESYLVSRMASVGNIPALCSVSVKTTNTS
jgi:hypothetical protein